MSVPDPPAYDGCPKTLSPVPRSLGPLKMSLTSTSAALVPLAEGGGHESLSPLLVGGLSLAALLLLLFITTSFNRDR